MTGLGPSDTGRSSSGERTVYLKKPHPCGGDAFTVLREGVVAVLRCNRCRSIVRMPGDRLSKALKAGP